MPFPTQTQLYSLYIAECVKRKITKPNKHILDLLEEENYNRRQQVDNAKRDVSVTEIVVTRNEPLARCTSIPDMHLVGPIGSKGMLALIPLLAECSSLTHLDLSCVPNIFAVDAYKAAPSGNEVITELCNMLVAHPSIRSVDITKHPIGSLAANSFLEALRGNGRLVELRYETSGVAALIMKEIEQQLQQNSNGSNPNISQPSDQRQVSPAIAQIALVDRKSSAERLALSVLLVFAFGPSAFEGSKALETATYITLGEAALRGSKDCLYLVDSGSIELSFGPTKVILRRGDYFGEPVNDVLHSSGLMNVAERGTAFKVPLADIAHITTVWANKLTEHIPFVRKIPLFQPLHMWVLCRLCHQCEVSAHSLGDSFMLARDGATISAVVSGNYVVKSEATNKSKPVGPLDLYGHETIYAKLHTHPKTVECTSEVAQSLRFDYGTISRHVLPVVRESLLVDLTSGLAR